MTDHAKIAERAIAARTTADVQDLVSMLETAGAKYSRAVGDKSNNQGLLTQSGASYDHKLTELFINGQDGILERLALRKFGDTASVPYKTPKEAAQGLLTGMGRQDLAQLCTVTVDSYAPGEDKRKVSITVRDRGCGITTADVPRTIFQVGARRKNGVDWLQGTFGLGGTTTYRNAEAVVLVTRRDPDLLGPGDEDRITIAVVQWDRRFTTTNAHYQTVQPWDEDDPTTWAAALPFSLPAAQYPDFEPGAQVTLIGYSASTFSRRSGDEKSLESVIQTRLFRPVMPVGYRNNIVRARLETLDGLGHRLDQNPPADMGKVGSDTLPFRAGGHTYKLPVWYRIFEKPNQDGGGDRRRFVASGHALLITSNGQVHRHWTPQEFKAKTRLHKLEPRILVVVEADPLPLELRTALFTSDRAQFVQSPDAVRLEQSIAEFLDSWTALNDANNALIREQLASAGAAGRSTVGVAQQIARAIAAKGGFSTGGRGTSGGGRKTPRSRNPEDLHENPTHFEGPDTVEAARGTTKSVYFKLNAKDRFIPDRADLQISCTHPDISDDEITIGELSGGIVRVAIVVPEDAALGEHRVTASIPEWTKTSGGLGPAFNWNVRMTVVDETRKRSSGRSGPGGKKGTGGPADGGMVALIWRDHEEVEDWRANTVGEYQEVQAEDLASVNDDYKELKGSIPTVVLNSGFAPLKSYLAARTKELTEDGTAQAQDRYAVGAGVAVIMAHQMAEEARKKGRPKSDEEIGAYLEIAARSVLSVLPEADRILRETGLEGQ